MLTGLDAIDWSSMHHAYSTAEEIPELLRAMASADPEERKKAHSRFYGAVHHQGDVYNCTVAALPFLLELATDDATPDRAAVVNLLVSIGEVCVERGDELCYTVNGEIAGYADGKVWMRRHAEAIVAFAVDADQAVRRAAIPGLALFVDDVARASALLRERLPAETAIIERLAIVTAMATLALRVPAAESGALAWFDAVTGDEILEPELRLAAVAQRARCSPQYVTSGLVSTATALLSLIAEDPVAVSSWADPSPDEPTPPSGDVPPHIADAFTQLGRVNKVHAPVTEHLRTLHTALGGRVTERTTLLARQLQDPAPGSRLDAIRMAGQLMTSQRGDHSALIRLVAGQLDSHDEVAAEAADVLEKCHAIAEPARQALADRVAGHGPDAWSADDPQARRAHQASVRALARLGDTRALPSLLFALDADVDAWRAVQVAGHLSQATEQLAPRLCERLRRTDIPAQRHDMATRALLSALRSLADPASVPAVADALQQAARHEQWGIAASALDALATYGPAASQALEQIRALTVCEDAHARSAAVKALWAVEGDPRRMMPLLLDHLHGPAVFWIHDACDILGEIGPDAVAAVPRLRELLTARYEWTRIHAAAALWNIVGDPETQTVLDVLLHAWDANVNTADFIVNQLERMGPAAAPALPHLLQQLVRTQRDEDPWATVDDDDTLQRACRTLIARLS
jgi:hypothetical protein